MERETEVFDVERAERRRSVLLRLVGEYRAQLAASWRPGSECSRSRVAALRSSIESALREIRGIERKLALSKPQPQPQL